MTNERQSALRRLQKELDEIKSSPPVEVMVGPIDDNNLFQWEGILNGPEDSPYSGGVFKFVMNFSNEYPMKAPVVRFTSKLYHPNISINGQICVDILQKKWSSAYTISQVMIAISSLLTDPNPDSPLNAESAQVYKTNRNLFNKRVREWVRKYASPENL